MTDDRDRIREDIETTRESLSRNVDALTDTITPSAIARRQADKAGARLGGIRDRVMGTASDVSTRTSDRVGGAAGAGQALREQATGNPLAAGAIALAAGWLLGSLLPASRQERQAAATLKEKATPLVEEAKSVAAESAATLKEPASNAAAAVKESATQAAQAVRETATEAAQDVRASAQQSAQTVKDQAQG